MSPKGGRETNKDRERGKGCVLQAISHGHLDSAAGADMFLLKGGSCRAAGARLKNASARVTHGNTCGINSKFFTNNSEAMAGRTHAGKKEPAFQIRRALWGGKCSKII